MTYRNTNHRTERSLGDLVSELSQETSTLIRQEVQLAKAEVNQKVGRAGKNVVLLAAGGFVAFAGFLALVYAAILGLALFMPAWLAALIIGLIVAVIGYALLQMGLKNLNEINAAPEQTIETLKEDKEWLNHQFR